MNIHVLYRIIERYDPHRKYVWILDWNEDTGLVVKIVTNADDSQHTITLPLNVSYSFRHKIKGKLKILEEIAKVLKESTEE